MFLIAAEDHDLLRRCHGCIKCQIADEEGNKTQQTEVIVEPMKQFEDKSHFLTLKSLSETDDDVVGVEF